MVFGKGKFVNIPKELIVKWAKLGGETSRLRSEERKRLYYLNPKRCKQCEKIIPYEKRKTTFCNKSCSAIFNNIRGKNLLNGDKPIFENIGYETTCAYCGSIVKRTRKIKVGVNIFCSHEHQNLYYTKYKIEEKQHIKPSTLRHYLIETRGYKCEECKLTEWMGKPIPLDSHHIDGDSKNNDPSNLKLLCKNCHGQTDNYGAKNIGKGTRKNYYKKKGDG